MVTLYSLLLFIVILVTLPLWIWRYFTTPKYRGTVLQRLGWGIRARAARPRIWIHAVSVGETLAAQGLIQALQRAHPDYELVVSTVTKTGQQIAQDKLTGIALVFHLPIDLPWITRHVMRRIRPSLLLIMETELWPGLLATARERRVPVVIVNGRISPRSFANYRRVRFFMRRFLSQVHLFVMQSPMDASRIQAIGVPQQRIRVSGNIKYDQALLRPNADAMRELHMLIGQKPDEPVFLAASTHPGEEDIILHVFARLRDMRPTLRLILVPRHPERANAVAMMIQKHGFSVQLVSQSRGAWPDTVLLVDQVGWLTRLYAMAHLVFVGGSLIPHGGQNMLEPAGWGLPVTFGPHTFNFKDAVHLLVEAGAALVVHNEEDLFLACRRLLQEPDVWHQMGQKGREVVAANSGALARTLQEITPLLEELRRAPSLPVA
ncbi:MAG: 3-deoxy-D-manno-octulosonic acid transferase [Magnetococcales bacterium]|nr:3-deoxy-D-manno-octulosonic acid transferase [Magnetococcales bacterium]